MRVLTGIQPTNTIHIGNLFGALAPAVEMQREHNLFMMVADYHAITVKHDPKQLHENILFTTACYLAAGIDPKKTILFQQSQVPEHTELAWILQTVTRMGEAERMTQFKDKAKGKEARASVGLFTYPILMASDILLYQAEGVPVGQDQKQHLELTRDLAERFNRDYGEAFTVPEPMIRRHGARIRALDNPEKKMSKSAPSAKSYISVLDDKDTIHKKIRSAVTDSERSITVDDNRPGLKNLLSIFHLVTEESMVDIAARYDGQGMKALKDELAEALYVYLAPLQAEIKGWMKNESELKDALNLGSDAAQEVAEITLKQAKAQLGVAL